MHLRKRRQHPDQAIFGRISCRQHCEPRPCATGSRYLTPKSKAGRKKGVESIDWAGGAGLWVGGSENNSAGELREGGRERVR